MSQKISSLKQILVCLIIFFGFHWFARNGYDTFAHTIAHLGFFFLALYLSWHLSKLISLSEARVESSDKAVLITGCDTGFGNFLAKQLNNLGYQVFAGVLFPDREGAQNLSKYGPNIHVIKMDVTNSDDIQAAADYVDKNLENKRSLWAVVNNAGIGGFTASEWGNFKENFENLFDVNTFGVVRVTRAFLPLLRQTKSSRFVIVGSFAGQCTLPGLTSYSMTKYAVRAFANGLRREISNHGISVSIIEPGLYETNIADNDLMTKYVQNSWLKSSVELREELGEQELHFFLSVKAIINSMKRSNVEEVIEALLKSVTSKNPRIYYRVSGFFDKILLHFFSLLPIELQDFFLDKICLSSMAMLVQNQS